jgi:hypothetical protein
MRIHADPDPKHCFKIIKTDFKISWEKYINSLPVPYYIKLKEVISLTRQDRSWS